MKKGFTFIIATLICFNVLAQTPNMLSYQAVVRNSNNQLVVNTAIGMRISILQTSDSGAVVYSEVQTPTTNANGLASVKIGNSNEFNSIDWSQGIYFIKSEIDITGGTNYTISATSQLLSVPFALYAQTANRLQAKTVSVTAQSEWVNLMPATSNWGTWTFMGRAHDFNYAEKYAEWRVIIGDNPSGNVFTHEVANFGNAPGAIELRVDGGYVQGRWTGYVGGGASCRFLIQKIDF